MKIAILDDYQDCVRHLDCFKLLDGHEVKVFTNGARGVGQLAIRLAEFDAGAGEIHDRHVINGETNMPTLTANAPVRQNPALPIMLHQVPRSQRCALSALRKREPLLRETAPVTSASALASEANASRHLMQERVLDRVVDRLMAELGWGGRETTNRPEQSVAP